LVRDVHGGAAAAGFLKFIAAAVDFLKIHHGSSKFITYRVVARFFSKPSRHGSDALAFFSNVAVR
jgi:hypothetical protein